MVIVIVFVIVNVIVSLGIHAVVGAYIIAGVGRLDVAYPHIGAMRRPERRGKRGETYSHVFFVSIIECLCD